MRISVPLLCLCFSMVLRCGAVFSADVGPLSISVPPGFDGPSTGEKEGGVTSAWVKHRPGSEGGTLLQVTSIDMGAALNGITRAQRAEGAKHYLMEFVGGVARRRENFKQTEVEALSLAGVPAARLRWTGTVEGSPAIGVMYCVLVGTTIISLHTQDLGSEVTPAMKAAMAAIESVVVR